jgi:hypothetical protein
MLTSGFWIAFVGVMELGLFEWVYLVSEAVISHDGRDVSILTAFDLQAMLVPAKDTGSILR